MNRLLQDTLLQLDREHLWHPYASMTTPPPVNLAESASGTRIRLADGTELIDAVSSWWCMAHGHNHLRIVEAVQVQLKRLAQVMFAGFTHEPAIELGRRLAEAAPGDLDRVFFADSGSVAVECAAKLAVQYQLAAGKPGRCRLAALRGGYHGDTAGAMALSDPEGMHTLFRGLLVQHHFAPQPVTRFGEEWDPADFAPMAKLLDRFDSEIAAVIVEPIFQGANAMRFYHPEYLRQLRRACDEHGILLICDEIATGFGRTGEFFASDYAGIVPDIMCVGKALTGGTITLAAAITRPAVAEIVSRGEPGRFMHGPTFMANPLACAAGCASLALFEEYDWRSRVAAIETQLSSELHELRNLDNVSDTRVLGAVGVVELNTTPPPETVQRIVRETGVWLRPFGPWLYTMPPFITTPEEISRITAAMRQVAEAGSSTSERPLKKNKRR